METQTYSLRKKDIQEDYKRSLKKGLGIVALSGLLGIGVLYGRIHQSNIVHREQIKIEKTEPVITYNNARETLTTLNNQHKATEEIKLPYKPKEIRKTLEDVFQPQISKKEDLESAILEVREDIDEMEDIDEIRRYNDLIKERAKKPARGFYECFAIVLVGGFMGSRTQNRALRRKREELEVLEKQR